MLPAVRSAARSVIHNAVHFPIGSWSVPFYHPRIRCGFPLRFLVRDSVRSQCRILCAFPCVSDAFRHDFHRALPLGY